MIRPHTIRLEDLRRQQEAIRVALGKYHAGEKLTEKEWTLVAYTPASQGGTAAACCRK